MKFSYEKYLKWCEENKQPIYPWAKVCIDKEVDDWNGEYGFIDDYCIEREWVEE